VRHSAASLLSATAWWMHHLMKMIKMMELMVMLAELNGRSVRRKSYRPKENSKKK
jgi:hypothetical protein